MSGSPPAVSRKPERVVPRDRHHGASVPGKALFADQSGRQHTSRDDNSEQKALVIFYTSNYVFPIPQLLRTTSEEVTCHGTILFHVLHQREVKWTPPRIWFTVNNDEIGSCVLWQSSSSRSGQSARHGRFAALATVTAATVAGSPWLGSFKSFKGSVIQSAEPDENGVDNTKVRQQSPPWHSEGRAP